MEELSNKHIEVILKLITPFQDSDVFWDDNNGRLEPMETKKSKELDKILNEAIEILNNKLT